MSSDSNALESIVFTVLERTVRRLSIARDERGMFKQPNAVSVPSTHTLNTTQASMQSQGARPLATRPSSLSDVPSHSGPSLSPPHVGFESASLPAERLLRVAETLRESVAFLSKRAPFLCASYFWLAGLLDGAARRR